MLTDILKNKNCFKLICGAGNEDVVEVERLAYLYSLAGCQFFDVCAKESVINATKSGLQKAGIKDRYICISVGSESDKHFCKAQIDKNLCANCGACREVCLQQAIDDNFQINQVKCIGCGKCIDVCPNNAINLIQKKTDLNELLPPLINLGLDCIEFHVAGDEDDIQKRWENINRMFDGILSISINRAKASDEKVVEIVEKMLSIRKPFTTIIQADGIPMSGGKDNYNSTLQAISTADLFKGKNLPAYIMVSGGTNSKTKELANLCNVDIDGVAVGSFARKIVKEYTSRDDFFENEEVLNSALEIAKNLVQSTM
ncbi:MAG: 4Fe-4S binding protein [Candidatus Gastranaerophilales bacterium]|nr:4Fe-4S binding protein [Candidatus Gastranaerophilales bacterium]